MNLRPEVTEHDACMAVLIYEEMLTTKTGKAVNCKLFYRLL